MTTVMTTAMHEVVQIVRENEFRGCPLVLLYDAEPLRLGEFPCIGCPYNTPFSMGRGSYFVCILTLPYRPAIRTHFHLVNT